MKRYVAATMIGALLYLSYHVWHARQQAEAERRWQASPEYALQQILDVRTMNDFWHKADFSTRKGQLILLDQVLDHEGKKAHPGLTTSNAQIHGSTCFFPFTITDEGLAGRLQFVNDGKWKFDDVIFTKIDGHDVNDISLAYVKDHPDAWPHEETDWGHIFDIALSVADIFLRARGR